MCSGYSEHRGCQSSSVVASNVVWGVAKDDMYVDGSGCGLLYNMCV